MINVLSKQKHDYMVATGAMHAANIAKGLKEKGQAVLLIDAMDKNLNMDSADEDSKSCYADLQATRDMNIIINGKPPHTIGELFAHAAVAEFAFDYEKNPGFQALAKQAFYANLGIEQPQRGR